MTERPAPGSLLFGLAAIARYAGISEDEAKRRIITSELPVEITKRGLPIIAKVELDRIIKTPHWNRQRSL